jgi:hypothetical protein
MIAHQSSGVYSTWLTSGRPAVVAIRNDLKPPLKRAATACAVSIAQRRGSQRSWIVPERRIQACRLTEAEHKSNPNHHKLTDYVDMPGSIIDLRRKNVQVRHWLFRDAARPLTSPTAVSARVPNQSIGDGCFSDSPDTKYRQAVKPGDGFLTAVETNLRLSPAELYYARSAGG